MVERKCVIEGLRINYSGIFEIQEFFKLVEDWMDEKQRQKEIKKKLEHVEVDGKFVEWFIECWRFDTDLVKTNVILRARFKSVKDVILDKGNHKKKYQNGDALILLDGFVETRYEGQWTQNPVYAFMRTLWDKYIHKGWSERYDAPTRNDANDLYKRIDVFFKGYRYVR